MDREFLSADVIANRLGVAAAWLRAEARANRVPCLRTGARMLFNFEDVRDTLRDRARHAVAVEQPA